ncbi:MAG: phage tail protein [Lewinella sp.]|nr:phage tail protein [Lewinella sp.]
MVLENHFSGDLTQPIKPQDLVVSLQQTGAGGASSLKTWLFVRAYPTKWEISSLDERQNKLVVESLTLTYSYFQTV